MIKTKTIISIVMIAVLLGGCSGRPLAPTQPDSGYVKDYTSAAYRVAPADLQVSKRVTKHNDGTVYIKNIPFFIQGKDNTCAQACMTSLLNYWGVKTDYQSVINET